MRLRSFAPVLLTCLISANIGWANEASPTSGDPAEVGLMTPAARSDLNACVAQAAQSAGDGQERRAMVGVFIGSKGKAVSLAILESSGLERLDKLVLRCLSRANFSPPTRDKAPLQWIFTTSLGPKRTSSDLV